MHAKRPDAGMSRGDAHACPTCLAYVPAGALSPLAGREHPDKSSRLQIGGVPPMACGLDLR